MMHGTMNVKKKLQRHVIIIIKQSMYLKSKHIKRCESNYICKKGLTAWRQEGVEARDGSDPEHPPPPFWKYGTYVSSDVWYYLGLQNVEDN